MPPRSTKLTKADFEHLSEFRAQLRKFLRYSEDVCNDHEVTALQYLLLLHLAGAKNQDWLYIHDLSEKLQAKHHGVVALIDRCESLGLVKRRSVLEDKRKVAVHLLAKGRKLVAQIATLHRHELEILEETFTQMTHLRHNSLQK